jgi:hypothetical protein
MGHVGPSARQVWRAGPGQNSNKLYIFIFV